MDEATVERPEDSGKEPRKQVLFWLNELDLADKREKDWRETAHEIVEIYEAGKKDTQQFNILYSNTETISPALYNTLPRPVVRRRFKEKDSLGLLASKIANRVLEYSMDTNLEVSGGFEDMVEQVVHEALLVGRGIPWLGFKDQTVTYSCVPWDMFRCSYGKRVGDIWWMARLHFMTRDELEENFPGVGRKVVLGPGEGKDLPGDSDDEENRGSLKTAPVWEIWDKRTRRVYFLSPNYKEDFLRNIEDPLELSGFFPCPRQLIWQRKVSKLVPVAPYELYEKQAEELNAITLRINRIVRIMKVRGAYDASVEGFERIFQQDDGILAPIENVAALQGGAGKLDSAVWLVPIEKLVAVLQQLYAQREQVKQVIFEITGLADILRGSSKASETLGAQEIKERWGGMRVKRMQKSVQSLVRAIMRATLEIVVKHTPTDTLYDLVQLSVPRVGDKQAAAMQINQMVKAGQTPPEDLVATAKLPAFEEALDLLRRDLSRSFRVDIETNSTVDVEATEDKQLVADFMQATGQFIQGVSPLVVQGVLPFQAAQGMLLAISRRMRFSDEVEEYLEQMQPPKDDGSREVEKQKLELEQQAKAAELAMKQKELELDSQKLVLEKEKVLLERERVVLEREQTALEVLRVQQDATNSERAHLLEKERMQQAWNEKVEERRFQQEQAAKNRDLEVQKIGTPKQIADVQSQIAQLGQLVEGMQALIQQTVETLQGSIDEVRYLATTPRKRTIERGPDGRAVSIDGLPLTRDAAGRIISLG